MRSQRPTIYHLFNALLILTTDYLLIHFFGWKPVLYLLFSSFFAGSLHPCAAHFIAEHYLMKDTSEEVVGEDVFGLTELAKETTSYYGWLNLLCYNVSCSFCEQSLKPRTLKPGLYPVRRSVITTNITISLRSLGLDFQLFIVSHMNSMILFLPTPLGQL